MKTVGETVLGSLWALKWACQTFFGPFDRYWWEQYISDNIFIL